MKFILSVLIWTATATAFAQGGPPMITDDPHTVGNNKWEINIAQLSISSSSGSVFQSPYLDVNYGLGDSLQLKYESGVSSVIPTAIPYGGSYANAGVRYRFFGSEDSDIQISTYPQYSFYPSYYGNNSAVNMGETAFFLPVEFSQKFGEYAFNPEIGYGFVHGDDNFWSLGVLGAREMTKTWALMAEIHTQSNLAFTQSQYLFNVGTAVDLTETFTVLASAGTTFAMPSSYWVSYLGLQLHL